MKIVALTPEKRVDAVRLVSADPVFDALARAIVLHMGDRSIRDLAFLIIDRPDALPELIQAARERAINIIGDME